MIPSRRRDLILEKLVQNGKVEITELSQYLNVAEMTIRRDLRRLEEQEVLECIRGGATRINRLTAETIFEKKSLMMKEEKIAVGRALPQFMESNDTVFISGGTTAFQAAANLQNFILRIITNNPALTTVDFDKGTSLIVLGGEFRPESHSIVGEQALGMLSQIHANKAIIGVDGLSLKYGITNSCFLETGLNRKMIDQTHGKVIVVADHTKIGKVGSFSIAPLDSIDILITTKGFPEKYYDELNAIGISVIIAN